LGRQRGCRRIVRAADYPTVRLDLLANAGKTGGSGVLSEPRTCVRPESADDGTLAGQV